jgi:signal transduction histidine kinase
MAEAAKRLASWRWFDPALAVALTAASLIEIVAHSRGERLRTAALVVAFGAVLAVRTRRPAGALVAASVLLVTYPHFDRHAPQLLFAMAVVLTYSCGAHASRSRGLAALGLLAAAIQIGMGFTDFPNVEIALFTVAPWLVGHEVRTRRELAAALAQRNRDLEGEEERFAALSVRRERLRIAGELHDVVGHRLAVIVVQAQAGERARDAPTRAEFLAAIGQTAGEALSEMSELVEALDADAGEDRGGLRRLRVLLDDANVGGIAVSSTLPPPDAPMPSAVEDAAYRIVREGLTNAIKHAPGAELQVRVALDEAALQVEVSDSGAANPSTIAHTGSGMGLTGMRQRVEALGGNLYAGRAAPGGWTVSAWLPTVPQPSLDG